MNNQVENVIEIFNYAKEKNLSPTQAGIKMGKGKNYVSDALKSIEKKYKARVISREEYDEVKYARQECVETKNNITENNTQRAEGERTMDEVREFVVRNMNLTSQEIANRLDMPNAMSSIAAIKSNITRNGGKLTAPKRVRTNNNIESNIPDLTLQEIDELNYDASSDKNFDERSLGETIRGKETFTNENGKKTKKIIGYKYRVMIKGESDLAGTFSREEMDAVYRLYSHMDGAGLTLRAVSREFPNLSFRDFKRILRAFNITKSSLAIAPHRKEEMTEDEIVSLILRNKENSVLKKLDNDRGKHTEKRLFEVQKELFEYKSSDTWINDTLDKWFSEKKIPLIKTVKTLKKDLKKSKNTIVGKSSISIFGDIHYGKKYEDTIFGRGFNKDIAHERVMKIAEHTVKEAKEKNSPEIVMICMGDLLESAMSDGMHPGHALEMDLVQDKQIMFAINSMTEMIKYVVENSNVPITYCSINGNHDRIGIKREEDKNRTAGKLVTAVLQKLFEKEKRINFQLPENNLLKLIKGNLCVFAHHGDSSLMKKKPADLINLFGQGPRYFNVILTGHWHRTKIEDGTNHTVLTIPSVTSSDKYIIEELGNNTLPGFIMASEAECGYGLDYKKITLY